MTQEKGPKITIDQLAAMMASSFSHLEEKVDAGFKEVNQRLDRIEFKLNVDHENRISRIEDDVRIIKTKLDI